MESLKKKIREVPDFPTPGILYYDLTTLFKDPEGLKGVIDHLVERYADAGIEKVLGIESRGFILGSVIAYKLRTGFIPVRKKGKLPAETYSVSYDLEYGTDTLEMHQDALEPGENVLIVDDLIATGGTAAATAQMVSRLQARIHEIAFLVELEFLKGRKRLDGFPVYSILKY
jgi:adenine phosphoribosyltransferase